MNQDDHTYSSQETSESTGSRTPVVLVVVLLLVILVVALFFAMRRSPESTPESTDTVTQVGVDQTDSELPQDERSVTLSVETGVDNSMLSVSLIPEEEVTVSAIAVRLIYDPGRNSTVTAENFSIVGNNNLTEEDWSFPVSSASFDEDRGVFLIDLAAINVSTEGYSITDTVELATIEISGEEFDSSMLSFDADQTKVITKDARELNTELVLE